ncbi:MAG TPA: hypothetical protein PLZ43_16135, partial [bacterium]|nr:hypothetical protein [bacterium]
INGAVPSGGNENVNPAYFRNQQRYTRTERLSKDSVEVSYYYYKRGSPNDLGQLYCLGAPCNRPIDGLQRFIIEKFKEIVTGPSVFERPGMEHFFNNDYGSNVLKGGATLSEWNTTGSGTPSVKTASRPQNLVTVTKNIEGANIGLSIVPQGNMQFMGYNPESTAGTFYQIVEMDRNSNGDWRTVGILSDTPENFNPVTSTSYNGNLYVVSREGANAAIFKNIYVIFPVEYGENTCSGSGNIFVPELIGSLPDLSNITIHSFPDGLVAVGEGGNGMEVHKLVENNGDTWFENITGAAMPSMRDVYSVEIKDGVLYLAGGIQIEGSFIDFKTDIWKFTEPGGWSLIRNDLNLFPVSLKIDLDGTDIILTDRIFKSDATTERVKFNADGTGVTPVVETVPVEGVPAEGYGDYCLNETDELLKGGLEMTGECVPFTHPWYKQFSTGSTVYSVAGKGDRLYVGTSNSIKVYDISDPNALTLKYTFSTSNRIVYDLEIADGDIMYAATSKGLYKLSTANTDSLSVIGSFYSTGSYNYQYKIQLYNDKLYVGDDNGINIRNKDTFARLAYVNIGSVLDFAIANGEIAMYWSAFWDEGIQIRGVDSLNMKAYDYATCYTGELATDHGAFYLSCDDYEYRFAGLPNTYLDYFPVDGDIREMQENYAYNGWAYISDGSYVKVSTSNDVPAVCGNGVTEPGELCDGNSVECTTLNPDYTGGSAACNSTCNGYNEVNCE